MSSLASLRALLVDLDGVLWVGNRTLPGVAHFFELLRTLGLRYLLVSNNATRRSEYTVARLRGMDIFVEPEHVLTAADAAPRWLRANRPDLRRVYIVGETALFDALREAGYEIVDHDAEAVVVGLDRQLTYQRLEDATLQIRAGAEFIATNADKTLPTERGLTPGSGSIVAAVVAATDVQPVVIGKPARPLFDLALSITGTAPGETAMLGDRLDTDIDGAAAAGLQTILILTGVSTRAQAERNKVKPDYIFADLDALSDALLRAPFERSAGIASTSR